MPHLPSPAPVPHASSGATPLSAAATPTTSDRPLTAAPTALASIVRWTAYPVVAAATVAATAWTLATQPDPGRAYPWILGGIVVTCLALELAFPRMRAWRPTRERLLRDIFFLLLAVATSALGNGLLSWTLVRALPPGDGLLSDAPAWTSVLALLVVYETIQYAYHRASHEMRGRVGRFLWRVHAVHHRPEAVTVLMHPVAHPLQTVVVQTIAMALPVALLRPSVDASFVFHVIVGLQIAVSHWNVDARTGWLDFLLVGAETHRVHHGTGRDDGWNYAAVLAPFDVVLRTFRRRPGATPERVGVLHAWRYPAETDLAGLMRFPFRARRRAAAADVTPPQERRPT